MIETILEQIKEKLPLLVALNLFLTLILLFSTGSNSVTIYSPSEKGSQNNAIKLHICKSAFEEIKNKKISEFFVHPDLVEGIQKQEVYKIGEESKIFSKMAASELCNVVIKTQKGFKSFQAVIREDGPIHYRITSITHRKPEYHEIKEYL